MDKRVLIKNAKIIGRLEHYPRDFVAQNIDNPNELYRIPKDRLSKSIGDIGSIMYVTTSNEGFYTFE